MLTPDSEAYPVLNLVDGGPVQWVGRSVGLPDGKRMSRQHCQFWSTSGTIFMQDGSACGTWLNGSRVEKAQPVSLRAGDVVSFPTAGVELSPTYKCSAAKKAARGKQRAAETSAVAAPKRQRASPKSKAAAPAPALDRRQLAALAAEAATRRAEAEAARRAEAAAEAKAKAEAETGAKAKAKAEAEVKADAARLAAAAKAAATKAKAEAEEAARRAVEEAVTRVATEAAAEEAKEEAAAGSAGGGSSGSCGSGGSAGGGGSSANGGSSADGGGGGGGGGGSDDDECVFVKEDDARVLNLPHARFDCRKFVLSAGMERQHCDKCWCGVCQLPVRACVAWPDHSTMTRAAAAEAAAAAKQARLRAMLDAAPPPHVPPPGSAEAMLLADERWGAMRYTMLSYIANCTNGEDAVLAALAAVHDVDHAAALRLLRALQAIGEVLQLGDELHVRPGTTLTPAPPQPPPPPQQPPQPPQLQPQPQQHPVVHSTASVAAALAAAAAVGARGLAAPSRHAELAGGGAPLPPLSCSAGTPHQ